jgi:TonB family protein
MVKLFVFLSVFGACAGFTVAQVAPQRSAIVAKLTKRVLVAEQVTQPLKILSKPKAPYPDGGTTGGSICIRGAVTLRVTFQANGEVGKISVVSGLPYGATENAINAARRIKFVPAKINGNPVKSTKTIQYFFSEF